MSTSTKSALRGAFAWALALMAATLTAPAAAQNWTTLTCTSCHSTPPNIATAVTDGSGSTVLGLGESWMGLESTALAHVHAESGNAGSTAMANVTAGQFSEIYAYFLNLRDGAVGSVSGQAFGSRAVGVPVQTAAFSFSVFNYRRTALPYDFSIGAGSAPSHPGDYSIQLQSVSGTAGCTSASIPAATSLSPSSCTVSVKVTFTAGGVGGRNASLVVSTNGSSPTGSATSSGALTGSGFNPTPIFSMSPNPVSVSSRANSTGTIVATTIANGAGATAALTITNLVFSPATYTLDPSSGCVIGTNLPNAGDSCILRVLFKPTSAGGPQVGTVTVSHNAAGSPDTLTINGTGTQSQISPTASTLDFLSVQQNVTSTKTQTVTNAGTASLNFTAPIPSSTLALSGTAAADYTVTGCAGPSAPADRRPVACCPSCSSRAPSERDPPP